MEVQDEHNPPFNEMSEYNMLAAAGTQLWESEGSRVAAGRYYMFGSPI